METNEPHSAAGANEALHGEALTTPEPDDTHRGPIRVLHVDDDPEFADLAASFLERTDERFEVDTRSGAEEALAAIDHADYDCIVSDYDMPGIDGIEFLEVVRKRHPELPFILYTGKGSEEVASEAISTGVTDYLQKESGTSQYTVLANRIKNVVARYRTHQELGASRQRLSLFFEQSPLGIVEWDDQFRFARVNQRAQEILGYSEAELVGESWELVVPHAELENVAEVFSELKTASGGYHSINENVRKDGEHIVCEWHNRVVTDEAGDVVASFTLFHDVTAREHREAVKEAREAQFRAIAESATDAIVTIDPDSTIRYANPAVERIFGYEPSELRGESLTKVMPERLRDQHLAAVDRYLEAGEKALDWTTVEMPGLHRDGHELDLQISFSELEIEGEHRFTGIIRDVTVGT